jgi:hypothetical protein
MAALDEDNPLRRSAANVLGETTEIDAPGGAGVVALGASRRSTADTAQEIEEGGQAAMAALGASRRSAAGLTQEEQHDTPGGIRCGGDSDPEKRSEKGQIPEKERISVVSGNRYTPEDPRKGWSELERQRIREQRKARRKDKKRRWAERAKVGRSTGEQVDVSKDSDHEGIDTVTVPVKMYGVTMHALADSGATRAYMSADAWRELGRPERALDRTGVVVEPTDAQGNVIRVLGMAWIPMNIGGAVRKIRVMVTNVLQPGLIMYWKWMEQTGRGVPGQPGSWDKSRNLAGRQSWSSQKGFQQTSGSTHG